MFVVVVAQLAHRLTAHLNWAGLGEFALLFVPVWWAWTNEVYYTTRFDSDDDRVKRLFGAAQLLALVGVAAAIGQGVEGHAADLFAACYALIRTVQLLELVRAGRFVPEATTFTGYFVQGHSVGLSLWWVSLVLPDAWKPWVWTVGLALEIGTSLRAGRLYEQFPPHVAHLPERFGLFVLLVLGESFTGAAHGLLDSRLDPAALGLTALCVLLAVGVWWTYFDRLDDDAVRALARRGRSRPYLIWLYVHLPLTLTITSLGVAVSLVQVRATEGHFAPVAWLLGGSLALYLLCESVVCATGVGARQPTLAFTWGVRTRLLTVPVLALLPLVTRQPAPLVGWCAALIWLIALGDWFLEAQGQGGRETVPPQDT